MISLLNTAAPPKGGATVPLDVPTNLSEGQNEDLGFTTFMADSDVRADPKLSGGGLATAPDAEVENPTTPEADDPKQAQSDKSSADQSRPSAVPLADGDAPLPPGLALQVSQRVAALKTDGSQARQAPAVTPQAGRVLTMMDRAGGEGVAITQVPRSDPKTLPTSAIDSEAGAKGGSAEPDAVPSRQAVPTMRPVQAAEFVAVGGRPQESATALHSANRSDADAPVTQHSSPMDRPRVENTRPVQGYTAEAATKSVAAAPHQTLLDNFKTGERGSTAAEAPLGQHGLSTDRLLQTAPQPAAATASAHGPTETARHVAAQLAVAISQGQGKPTEIALNPEELGRVRLSLSAADASITLTVIAERGDTVDLMRRHIDVLAQEFRSLGYENINFSFDQQQNRPGDDGVGTAQDGEVTLDIADDPVARSGPALALGTVDIRL